MENEVLKNIKTRCSVRKFKPEQVSDEALTAVLEAGTYAPSSRGMQKSWIVAVQNESLRNRISALNAEIMGTDTDPFYSAPTIVLVVADNAPNAIYDGSIVLENMMLAAHSVGLGSCWIHREREMFASEQGKALAKELGIADDVVGIGALAIGYPADDQATLLSTKKPRKKDYYRIIK